MAALRLCLSGEMQYGVALKLTPELKRALLDAQHSGQPMRMILGKEQAKNVGLLTLSISGSCSENPLLCTPSKAPDCR